ncbi:MAG: hypothetical protein J6S72_08110 [Lachnospiraceae bacterium]|nr:hypothetical protein [Lachnospiraceae bacterium]
MKHLKKIVSVLLLLCMVAGGVVFAEPEKAEAWDADDGTWSWHDDYANEGELSVFE